MKKIFTCFIALTLTMSMSAQTTYEIIPVEMSNLVVTTMDGFEMLEASYPDMGLSVTLGVYPDGTLHEGSNVTHGLRSLPIVEGSINKTFNEEIASNVYTGLIVVDMKEAEATEPVLMGIQLTMFAGTVKMTDLTINNATAEMDGSILEVIARWDGFPVLLTINGYRGPAHTLYEGPQVSELTIGDADYQKDYAVATCVKVVGEGEAMTITGVYTSYETGVVYNVTVKTNVVTTAVENICVTPQATKIIRNGQLVICKDGVEYHVAGGSL